MNGNVNLTKKKVNLVILDISTFGGKAKWTKITTLKVILDKKFNHVYHFNHNVKGI